MAEHAQGPEGSRRKDHLEEAGPKPAHQRGAEQDAGDHLTYDGRLTRFAHQAAANAGSQDDKNELHEQTSERVLEVLAQVGQERGGGTDARTGLQGEGSDT